MALCFALFHFDTYYCIIVVIEQVSKIVMLMPQLYQRHLIAFVLHRLEEAFLLLHWRVCTVTIPGVN